MRDEAVFPKAAGLRDNPEGSRLWPALFVPAAERGWERCMDSDKARAPKRRRGVWGEAIRDSFLALLGGSGNASAALRAVGHPNMFYKRRRRDPVFAADWAAAVAAADARLRLAESPFLRPIEVKSMPPDDCGRPDADSLGG